MAIVTSLEKAIKIIDYLAERKEAGITEISNEFQMSKSSVYNILSTFGRYNWAEKDELTDKYKLGLKLFQLGSSIRSSFKLREIAVHFMKLIIKKTGEAVHLAIFDNGDVVVIESAQPENKFALNRAVGSRELMHCTAVGKAILAFKPDNAVDRIIAEKGLPVFTENTITDPVELKKHLRQIRVDGYAVDNMEHEFGIKCVAAPIRDEKGEVVASMSITGPSLRFSEEKITEYALLIKKITRKISLRLGWDEGV